MVSFGNQVQTCVWITELNIHSTNPAPPLPTHTHLRPLEIDAVQSAFTCDASFNSASCSPSSLLFIMLIYRHPCSPDLIGCFFFADENYVFFFLFSSVFRTKGSANWARPLPVAATTCTCTRNHLSHHDNILLSPGLNSLLR